MTVMGLFAPAFAQDEAEDKRAQPAVAATVSAVDEQDAPITTSQITKPGTDADYDEAAAPEAAISIEHIDIIVENEPFSVRSRRTDTGGVLIEASPIFTHLKGEVSIEGTALFYKRYQDGAVLSIDMAKGEASINGRVAGFLPGWKVREKADTWLGPNAIAFLTGTEPEEDNIGRWMFTLSEQLRPKFDLDLWIEGEQVTNPEVEPRTIGPILLIPLRVVTEALGHTVVVDGSIISVQRLQDSTTLTLNLTNGFVTVNNTPRGVTPDIAFADEETLLLPFSAVETLTGTHIERVPGTDRIDITLDDRLGGGVLPGERVDDEGNATGFVAESLDFRVSDRGPANLTFSSHVRNLNTQLVYDSAGGFDNIRELQPGFVGLNVQSLDGWVGSIGDANTRLRELSGVSASRIRGVTWRRQNQENGNLIALAAGARSNGSVAITEDASRPTFGGFVAGARVLKADRSQDIGVSVSATEGFDAGRVVIGGQKSIVPTRDTERIGLESLFASADTGLFFGAGGVKVDVRGSLQARGKITRQIGVQASIDYTGGTFQRSDEAVAELADAGQDIPSQASSFNASASTNWRSAQAWGPIHGVAAGLRATHSRQGGATGGNTSFFGGSFNGRIPSLDLNLSSDLGYTINNEFDGTKTTARSLNLRAQKRFSWGNLQAAYTDTDTNTSERMNRLVSTLNVRPLRYEFGEGASVAAGPTASVVLADGEFATRFGATLSANSGQKFGTKFNVQTQISALQSIDPDADETQFFASLGATYNISRNLQLTATYVETFQNSRDVSIGLRGRILFNGPRKYTKPKEGLGVLTGKVYLDRNRDGIRQDDEPGVNSVRVQVAGTRLALNVDRDGNFTIQNIPEGLYSLAVDRRSLPLGLVVPEAAAARATIAEGRITNLEIPIIASGQVRGSVFVDRNGNGEIDTAEPRIEGTYVTLRPLAEDATEEETISQIAASFGQFSFENLKPGKYELSVNHEGIVHTQTVELHEDDLFEVVPFGVGYEENTGDKVPVLEVEEELIGVA